MTDLDPRQELGITAPTHDDNQLTIARERIAELEADKAYLETESKEWQDLFARKIDHTEKLIAANERIAELENDLKMAHGCTVYEELICVQSQIEHERKDAEALGKKIHRTLRKKWLGALDAIRNEIEK